MVKPRFYELVVCDVEVGGFIPDLVWRAGVITFHLAKCCKEITAPG